MGGVLRVRVLPRHRRGVRRLLEEPVLPIVALPDGVRDVVRKEQRVAEAPAPEPVVFAVPLVELVAGPGGRADLPDLLAVTNGLPFELVEVHRLARLDGD